MRKLLVLALIIPLLSGCTDVALSRAEADQKGRDAYMERYVDPWGEPSYQMVLIDPVSGCEWYRGKGNTPAAPKQDIYGKQVCSKPRTR